MNHGDSWWFQYILHYIWNHVRLMMSTGDFSECFVFQTMPELLLPPPPPLTNASTPKNYKGSYCDNGTGSGKLLMHVKAVWLLSVVWLEHSKTNCCSTQWLLHSAALGICRCHAFVYQVESILPLLFEPSSWNSLPLYKSNVAFDFVRHASSNFLKMHLFCLDRHVCCAIKRCEEVLYVFMYMNITCGHSQLLFAFWCYTWSCEFLAIDVVCGGIGFFVLQFLTVLCSRAEFGLSAESSFQVHWSHLQQTPRPRHLVQIIDAFLWPSPSQDAWSLEQWPLWHATAPVSRSHSTILWTPPAIRGAGAQVSKCRWQAKPREPLSTATVITAEQQPQ